MARSRNKAFQAFGLARIVLWWLAINRLWGVALDRAAQRGADQGQQGIQGGKPLVSGNFAPKAQRGFQGNVRRGLLGAQSGNARYGSFGGGGMRKGRFTPAQMVQVFGEAMRRMCVGTPGG